MVINIHVTFLFASRSFLRLQINLDPQGILSLVKFIHTYFYCFDEV